MALRPGKNDGFENLGEVIAAFALRPSKNYAQNVKSLIVKSENIRKIQNIFLQNSGIPLYTQKSIADTCIAILCQCSRTLSICNSFSEC